MPVLNINLDVATQPWTDLAEATKGGLGQLVRIGRMTAGMKSGASSVALVVQMPDGRMVVAETPMLLFLSAAQMLKAREEEMSGSNAKN